MALYQYGNYNNYSASPLHALAHGQRKNAAGGVNQANNRNVQITADLMKYGHGDPRTGMTHRAMMAQVTPEESMAQQGVMDAAYTQQLANHNEAIAREDRQMDLAENSMMSQSADRRYIAELQTGASKYASDASRIPNWNRAGDGNVLDGLYANAPNVNLFDANGNRIGGSYYNQ